MKAKRIRCAYCDGYYDSSMNRCPSCGATNSELIEEMTELYNKEDDTDKIEDETEKIFEQTLVVKSKQEGKIAEVISAIMLTAISIMIMLLISHWLLQKTYEQVDEEINTYLSTGSEDSFDAVAVIDEKGNK